MNDERQSSTGRPLTLAEVEQEIITAGIERMDALTLAKVLGIGKTTLYRKLQQYGLNPKSGRHTQADPKLQALIDEFLKAANEAVAFLHSCTGFTAPRLGDQLKSAMEPFER